MKIFLILLLCQSFSLGPALPFQAQDYLAVCNGGVWGDEESHFSKSVSKKSSEGDPWNADWHMRSAKKSDYKDHLTDCNGTDWQEESHNHMVILSKKSRQDHNWCENDT